ncbi:MAG TPA: 4-alpha-glucanotransferase [Spirochaetales bacterium]|nr:4-alpha-glucanotransferase [Spirochaetales bacterium]HRY55345.1 4-alpha-glucanotransferase [Spirochaetia bacterium]
MRMNRSSGILLHPSSLPGAYGIGDIGPAAWAFVERLAEAGQGLWQLLPLGPTGYGDSPYAPLSSFAGNELLLSPELLEREGLVLGTDLEPARALPRGRVDYGALLAWKRPLLARAARRFLAGLSGERRAAFEAFRRAEAAWLPDYALFRAIKDEYDAKAAAEGWKGALWNNYWPEPLALREGPALAAEAERLAEPVARYEALQFLFSEQWAALRARAARAGIAIVGDLPIFVAQDSAEAWARRELFRLDERGRPLEVSGVPPDYFSEDGQLWGNPLYDWEAHRREGFAWWTSRLADALRRFDVLRIDHFRGFEASWSVPAGERTARRGAWKRAPGAELFAAVEVALGPGLPIIAEDLGFITEEVRELRDGLGLPGMRILQFAFDAGESGTAFDPANAFLPHNYVPRCVVYTGTHDNDTLAGWLAQASAEELAYLEAYLGQRPADLPRALLREAWKSVAAWALAPMQDLLGLGAEARMNRPSTLGGNWAWRMAEGAFSPELAAELRELSRLYGRIAAGGVGSARGPLSAG